MDPRGQQHDRVSHTNGLPPQTRALRIPSVHEALPYTPFSSIVPFNPDILTPPLSLPHTSSTAFHDNQDITNARQELDRLTAGARSAEQASNRCRQTLLDVQKLLNGDHVTKYTFKKTKRITHAQPDKPPPQPALSSFAKMILDSTNVSYRYLTPPEELQANAPTTNRKPKSGANPRDGRPQEHQIRTAQQPSRTTPSSQVAPSPRGRIVLGSPPPRESQSSARSSEQKPPATTPLLPQKPAPVPLIPVIPRPPQHLQHSIKATSTHERRESPGLMVSKQGTPQHVKESHPGLQTTPKAYVSLTSLTPAQRSEYQKVSDTNSNNTSSRNQGTSLAVSADQRQKADLALENLQAQLEAIFEAEDHMQPDTSGDVSMRDSVLFTTRDTEEGPALVLQADAQRRLDIGFDKVVRHNRLDYIEVDSLHRTQRICERSIAALNSGSLAIGDDWSQQDVNDWLERVSNAENGLVAARTLMRIMTGGAHRKELQSEDCLKIVLDAIRTVVETCIIHVIQERSSIGERGKGEKDSQVNPKFRIAQDHKDQLLRVVQAAIKLLRSIGEFFIKTDVDESGISSLEYLCKLLIFTENSATERDAALGIQKFENIRLYAMDVMAKIFAKYTGERNAIFDEILMSLEKLPANKQGARQFRMPDLKPIQLVSALLMRLVQTSATPTAKTLGENEEARDGERLEVEDSEDESESDFGGDEIALRKKKPKSRVNVVSDLPSVYRPLQAGAIQNATYIVKNLLQRALGTSKSGDEPYRKLLDIFVEDFINVLGSSDWPAAEVLLRALVTQMLALAENPKSPAPFRTLALELLGTIGTGVLDVRASAIDAAKALDGGDEISRRLTSVARDLEHDSLATEALVSFVDGPYRVVVEYLYERDNDDAQIVSARGYHLVQWAEHVCAYKPSNNDDESFSRKSDNMMNDLQKKLKHMINEPHWLQDNFNYPVPSTAQGRLAAKIVTASSPLCRAFTRIFNVILASMRSEQPTVRSRSLKSVTNLLEQDPSILDRHDHVMRQIVHCMSDSSSLVRDSALVLVQKCVTLRPIMELKVYEKVLERTTDTGVQVRKRAMTFSKQVYLHIEDNQVRAKISNAMISRIHDVDETVAEAARATIEEIWFTSFRNVKSDGGQNLDAKLQMLSHAALIIQTVHVSEHVAAVLEALLKKLLISSKQAQDNKRISKELVGVLFEGAIDSSLIPGSPSHAAVLRTLTVFAKAAPRLFNATQLEQLEPYAKNLTTTDDLEVYHFVVTILRYTMPVLSGIKAQFLQNLQMNLLQSVQKIPTSELSVVAPCLWTIDGELGNTERLMKFVISAMAGVAALQKTNLNEGPQLVRKATKLLTIVGQFGKACDFGGYLTAFKGTQQLSWYKGKSVDGMMVELCCKFTSPKQPTPVRAAALEAVCAICYAYPANYLREDVVTAIQFVLENDDQSLWGVLLENLESFIRAGEKSSDDPCGLELGSGVESGTQRLGGTYQATGSDSAYASLTQRFLPDILRIALGSTDEIALTAARMIASINTQGIAHPGLSAPSLVALQTCPTTAIAKMAFLSYKDSWTKHESTLEKTLLKSVREAFEYQREVFQNTAGCTGHPPVAKLHYFWDVLKIGEKVKSRKKFFANLCADLDFDPNKLTTAGGLTKHLLYVRFCVENIALFDPDTIGEALQIMVCLEKAFAGTGTAIAQAIEQDVLRLQVPSASQGMPDAGSELVIAPPVPTIEPARLQQLAISAQILSLIFETRSYIRRMYMLAKYSGKPKAAHKDEKVKALKPTNAPSLSDAYHNRVRDILDGAADEASQRITCSAFVELVSVDNEVKVATEEEEEEVDHDDEDDAVSQVSGKSPGPRGKKRKSMDSLKGPAKKRGRPKKTASVGVGAEDEDELSWV